MPMNPVLDFLRRIRTSDAARKTPDADLLARFVACHDEAAFAALVQRHGPMVWRLCGRVLGQWADAEDAFQAAFLVLARRASSLSRPELLGNWLYGVAYRIAFKVRAGRVRRHPSGRGGYAVDSANPAEEAIRRELREVVDYELSRLPDRYRVPVVLHYLEGHTQAEVARLLGCPCNTIATRLARACDRLRGRLAQRGVALSSGALAAALAEEALAAVPASLFDATVKAALLFTAGGTALVPPTIVAFAEGVMKAMFFTKVKIALGCILVLVTVAAGAGVLARPSPLPDAQAQAQLSPKSNALGGDTEDDAGSKELEKLQGTWVMSGFEHDGKGPAPQDVTSDARTEWTIRGNHYTIGQVGEMYKKQRREGYLRIDPRKKPKTIDVSPTKAFQPRETLYEIYELNGDRLTVCGVGKDNMRPEERPKEFKTAPGTKGYISYWHRQGTWNVGPDWPVPLAEAVEQLNRKANVYFNRETLREPPVPEDQRPRPVTVDQVVAAIRGWDRKKVPVADSTYRIFQQIADSKIVPPGALLSIEPRWEHPDANDNYEYRIWRIELAVMTGKNTGYSFVIREQRLDRRIALLPSPGYSWLEGPGPANPPTCFFTARFVVDFELAKDDALLIIVAWSTKGTHDLRVVVFDKEGNRYVCTPGRGGVTPEVWMRTFRLDPKKLPAAQVRYFGIEAVSQAGGPNGKP